MLNSGDVICSHLEIDAELDDLGASVFGPVYAARDSDSSEDVWLTIVSRRFLPGSVDVSQFMAQANGLRDVRHPSLVRVALVDREPEYCVIGYEWLPDATSVAHMIAEGRVPKAEGCALDVARALGFLHKRGMMHAALSSRTVLAWEQTHVLWQHGLATLCDRMALVQRSRRLPDEVFAPEFLRGEPLTTVADVHAWGVLIAELATGSTGAEAVNDVLHGIGEIDLKPNLLAVVRRALDASPDRRPRDGVQLTTMVEEALAPSGPSRAAVPTPLPAESSRPPPPPRDHEFSLGTGEFEVVGLDGARDGPPGSKGQRNAAKPRPAARPRSAGDSAADLDALAATHVEPNAVAAGPGAMTRLPQDQLIDDALDEALREARDSAPGGLGPPPPSLDPHVQPAPDITPDVAAAKSETYALPRLPGPHGPRAWVMTTWLLGLTVATVAGVAVPVAARAGGVAALFGIGPSKPPPAKQLAEAAEDTEGTEGTEGTDGRAVVPDAGATEPALPKLDLPANEDKHATCPMGAIEVGEKLCIDVGEFPGLMRVPRNRITHRDAAAICEERGGRLCTTKEWQKGCFGAKHWRYSYGGVFQQDRCNTASVAGFPKEIALSGSYESCVSAYGLHDMVGNVGEWVAEGLAVGGDSTTAGNVATCAAKGRPPPGYQGTDMGFRCCYDKF